MVGDREVIGAAFVVLSKLHKLERNEGAVSDLQTLKDLKKAIGILASFCGGEGENVKRWAERVEDLVNEVEEMARRFDEGRKEYSTLLKKEVVEILMRRLPQDGSRERVKMELERILEGESELDFAIEQIGSPESSAPTSELEHKLEKLESDASASGLDRFISTGRRRKDSSD